MYRLATAGKYSATQSATTGTDLAGSLEANCIVRCFSSPVAATASITVRTSDLPISPGFDTIARQTISRVTVRAGAGSSLILVDGLGAGNFSLRCWKISSRANNVSILYCYARYCHNIHESKVTLGGSHSRATRGWIGELSLHLAKPACESADHVTHRRYSVICEDAVVLCQSASFANESGLYGKRAYLQDQIKKDL